MELDLKLEARQRSHLTLSASSTSPSGYYPGVRARVCVCVCESVCVCVGGSSSHYNRVATAMYLICWSVRYPLRVIITYVHSNTLCVLFFSFLQYKKLHSDN